LIPGQLLRPSKYSDVLLRPKFSIFVKGNRTATEVNGKVRLLFEMARSCFDNASDDSETKYVSHYILATMMRRSFMIEH